MTLRIVELIERIAVALEKIAHHLETLSKVVITVEDRHGTDFKAIETVTHPLAQRLHWQALLVTRGHYCQPPQ